MYGGCFLLICLHLETMWIFFICYIKTLLKLLQRTLQYIYDMN